MYESKKLTDQTWDQAKILVAFVFKTPPPKIPQTWKQKDQKPPKCGIKKNARKSVGNQPKSKNV